MRGEGFCSGSGRRFQSRGFEYCLSITGFNVGVYCWRAASKLHVPCFFVSCKTRRPDGARQNLDGAHLVERGSRRELERSTTERKLCRAWCLLVPQQGTYFRWLGVLLRVRFIKASARVRHDPPSFLPSEAVVTPSEHERGPFPKG